MILDSEDQRQLLINIVKSYNINGNLSQIHQIIAALNKLLEELTQAKIGGNV